MGNCIKKDSSMQWGGDDWSDDYSPPDSLSLNDQINNHDDYNKIKEEKTGSLATNYDHVLTNNDVKESETKQVKLKITRKQLEQVLKLTTGVQGVSVEEVLAHLINVSINDLQSHQSRSWRPDLPTITEV